MKLNKHIHDEDYDINIKLMVPLLSILVCTICLCATTWAWYTASVSTGVNSIVAGVNATVTAEINGSPVSLNNGSYTLGQDDTLSLTFEGKSAANGYYALIDITNKSTNKSTPETALQTLFSLFVNRVYAEEDPIRKAVYFKENTPGSIKITNRESNTKIVMVKVVWADSDDTGHKLNTNLYPGYGDPKNGNEVSCIELTLQPQSRTSSVTVSYFDTENNLLPASILASEETQNFGLRENTDEDKAIFTYETEESTFTVMAPAGYLLQKVESFNEDTDVPSRTYQIEPGEEIEINVICVKIEEEHAKSDTPDEENQKADETVEVPQETEPAEITYQYTVNCIDTDSYTVIKTFTGESVPGDITIDIPLIDGYVSDSNTTVINVTKNVDANVFTVLYKKSYSYEIHYVDENGNILESASNQTTSNQVEVPLKQFDNKDLILLDGETADTDVRTFTINKELETNVFEIHYTTIVPPENIAPLQEEQLSSN